MWLHYEAVPKGCRSDAPSQCQVVISIQFHRKDRSPQGFFNCFIDPSDLERPMPFGLNSSPDEVKVCHPVTPNSEQRRVCFGRVKFVDPYDFPLSLLIRPCLLTYRVLYYGEGTIRHTNFCVLGQKCRSPCCLIIFFR